MSKTPDRYDADLQMFVEKPRPVSTEKLLFHRWLAQNGRYGHYPESRPVGDFAMALVLQSNEPIEPLLRRLFANGIEIGRH